MNDYYREFSDDICQDMSAEEIRRVLNGLYARVADRYDPISVEKQESCRAALEVFQDEESKRAYDQALAERGRKPPEEDPRQREQRKWFQSAVDFFKNEDYDLAKAAMNRALETGREFFDASQYQTAAYVYGGAEEYALAIDCVNEALLLEPQNFLHMYTKGMIYGDNAYKLAKDSRFSSSPELRTEYQKLRTKELDHLRKTCERASGDEERVFALERLADAEYWRPNQIDEEQAEKDRRAGARHVQDAQKLGQISGDAQKILEDFNLRRERRQRNAGLLNKLMESAGEHIEKRTFDEALLEIEEALKLDAEPNSRLYGLAADIYCWSDDLAAASGYIAKAMALEPENPYLIAVAGQLRGMRAWKTAKDRQFSSSPRLQKEYRALRKDELTLLREACARAREPDNQYYAVVLGKAAWALYFRPNQIDAEEAKKDRITGLNSAGAIYRVNTDAKLIIYDYQGLISRAEDSYKTGEYGKARSWIEKALELDEAGGDIPWNLYTLAAQIYLKNSELDTALRYIDKQIAQDVRPGSGHMRRMGAFCGSEALKLAEDSRFSSSPELQKAYRALRTKELALLNEACKLTRAESAHARAIAFALGQLAFAEYFRPDQLDKALAERDRRAGVQHALEAEKVSPGFSELASKVLEKNKEVERLERQRKAEQEARERRRREAREAEKRRRKEELDTRIKTARSYYDRQEYVLAKSVIVSALSMEEAGGGAYLYWLASVIYLENGELDTALRYIDKALALSPRNIYHLTVKGEIYGRKAVKISGEDFRRGIRESSDFQASPNLQKNYSALMAEELRLMEQAAAVAQESGNREERAYTLGYLAWVEYFRFDITKEGKRPDRNRARGVELARQALELGGSWRAQEVLDKEREMQELLNNFAKRAKKDEEDFKRWKKEMRRKGLLGRFF